jgi:hypothetical protein
VLLGVLAVPVAKWIRRWRRRHRSGAASVVGAWQDTVDRLVEARLRIPASATARECVEAAEQLLAGPATEAIRRLASSFDHAAYAPQPPSGNEPERAWADAASVRRAIRASLRLDRRIGSLLSPRPLLRRAGPREDRPAARRGTPAQSAALAGAAPPP